MRDLQVNLNHKQYKIFIQRGILKSAGGIIKDILGRDNAVIITDDNVDKLYTKSLKNSLADAGISSTSFVMKAGEESKTMDTLISIYNFLSDNKINRGDFIIALGGGVVGDVAGFAASTYMRGLPYIQIPSTLLAQIDSSVGGKVAVDLPQGKNMVGNFYHPECVIIDPDVLHSLKPEFFNDGMAEAIKYGCIKDKKLFEFIANATEQELQDGMEDMIYTCVDIKRRVVEEDEMDTGERMILNFGHTIGHAIERHYNYQGIAHGAAVAIGMYLIAKCGEQIHTTKTGCSAKIYNILKKYNLPTEANISIENILQGVSGDKKNFGETLNIILLKDIGECFIHQIKISDFSLILEGSL